MAFEKIPCRSNYISIHHFSKIQRVLFDAAGTYKSELGGEEKKTFFFLKKAVKSRKEKKRVLEEREREKRERNGGQVGIAVGSQISKSFSKDPFSLRDSLRCRREEKESERDREKSDKM